MVWFMAVAAAVGTATIYPLQPAIAVVAESVDSSVAAVGVALSCGPVGYLLGLAVLVPLVDRYPPRHLVALQFAVLGLALAASAVAGSPWLLGITVGIIGAMSTVGAQLSSVAGRFAPARRRATTLGIVTAGISGGIIGGRLFGGWLTDQIGWRNMLLVLSALCAVVASAVLLTLPAARGAVRSNCLTSLREMPMLHRRHPPLRTAAARGALWFFAFCAVWSGLAVALAQPPFGYSADTIGLFALAGLLGMGATWVAGASTDRVGARTVILIGLVLAGSSTAVLAISLHNTAATLICLALDAGLFAAQVANQSTVLSIDPTAPGRFNGAYMVPYFVGGSLGTAFGCVAVGWFGWSTTALLAAGAIGVAAAQTSLLPHGEP
ncbi:MFS transporter [Mycolicibacterium goodii]|uniref:MFS transporter n=1 Tax=Mycolicibacterium goodii TaxID=134601 RepID=A0A0K0X161_MYCGD|nr:MFS transporter [Mycolicibacterium goodii]